MGSLWVLTWGCEEEYIRTMGGKRPHRGLRTASRGARGLEKGEAVMQQQSAQGVRARPQRRIFYGWWIVTIGCILDAVKGGTFNTGFSLYFLPVLNELQLSRAATSLPFSLAK